MIEKSNRHTKGTERAFTLKKVLVPIDFSECSQSALEYSLGLAAQFHATVVLLHVVEPSVQPDNYLALTPVNELNQMQVENARERLKDQYQSQTLGRVPSEILVRMDMPTRRSPTLPRRWEWT